MKTPTLFLLGSLLCFVFACKRSETVEPISQTVPSFNQVNTSFDFSHIKCLISQWYGKKYQNEPIVFRAINDQKSYAAFFSCDSTTVLPIIDFTKNSLLIGMKADYGQFINTPVNISSITQSLTPSGNGGYTLRVKVAGEAGKNPQGGEWFAFTSVVPKVTNAVNLDMEYQFK